ncbi:RICIN domain-containing protein [Nocardiopsis sp. NPDC050513]|uniref:RICIN domain-containing protein n=1 Tax=Nocardiopsis sp. NPDC050513 TaxID=3364338 RepID=UPI0037AF576E
MRGKRSVVRAAAVIGAAVMVQTGLGAAGAYAQVSGPVRTAAPAAAEEYYFDLVNANSGKCATGMRDLRVVQWDCEDGLAQDWRLDQLDNGTFNVVHRDSGLCLSVDDPWVNGSPAILERCPWNGGLTEAWRLLKQPDRVRLQNHYSGQHLAVGSSSTQNGAAVIQWPQGPYEDQEWFLQPVE